MIDDEELQQRLKLLKKMFEDGRISFTSNLEHTFEAIKRVRMNPDGSVDLSTVDGSVRALALMAAVDHQRTELKKIPGSRLDEGTFSEVSEKRSIHV